MGRKRIKSFLAVFTAISFFCTYGIIGCATTTETRYREVRREEAKVLEYYTDRSGKSVDVKVVEEALRNGDIKKLEDISNIYRPISKEQVAPEEYSAGEVSLYQEYAGGTKYITVGANPQNMRIPAGWWPIGLPKDVSMTVGSGKDGKKKVTGVLKKGQAVWVYIVIRDGKPVIDTQKGILLQIGAVKQCGNQVYSNIQMWYPLPLIRQVAQKQVEILVLQKVIDRGQAVVYMEKESHAKYWMAGLIAVAAVGGYLIGKNRSSETVRTVKRPTPAPEGPAPRPPVPPPGPAPQPPPPPAPVMPIPGQPSPSVPYIGSGGQIVQPMPAPRPATL